MDKTGVAAVVEHGVRLSGRTGKISTRFGEIANIVREANYWAGRMDAPIINREVVERAIREKDNRVRLPEEKLQELFAEGVLFVETDGVRVGQVNGLSFYDLGDYEFGKPTRITARTALGRSGLINIEREAEMSGPTFNKAMLIIEGYFRANFGQDYPLAFSASICFEQSYGGIEGDSASLAELFVLFSSLSGVPLRQDLAVTGSVNQYGEVQPIGGVNEKIEGFFDVCAMRGLTGTQGVVIPAPTRRSHAAGRRGGGGPGRALPRLRGDPGGGGGRASSPACPPAYGGTTDDFPEGTVFRKVETKLRRYAEQMRDFTRGPGDGGQGGARWPGGRLQKSDLEIGAGLPHVPGQRRGPGVSSLRSRMGQGNAPGMESLTIQNEPGAVLGGVGMATRQLEEELLVEPVEFVPHDRKPRMACVDPDLVEPAGSRPGQKQGVGRAPSHHLEIGHRPAPFAGGNHADCLAHARSRIGAEGSVHTEPFCRGHAIDQSQILFGHLPGLELAREERGRLSGPAEEHDSARFPVQPVDDADARFVQGLTSRLEKKAEEGVLEVASRGMDREVGRFVDRQYPIVLEENRDRKIDRGFGQPAGHIVDSISKPDHPGGAATLAVQENPPRLDDPGPLGSRAIAEAAGQVPVEAQPDRRIFDPDGSMPDPLGQGAEIEKIVRHLHTRL